ncbi:aminoacylase-1 isoform X1 [Macrosteles quadrilineatus]|uniref:aminoacylase-1 isoform X1 n=1 Tax=Macrosteles quadrilineatus TaxID=74068 RepID=UPI0023E1AE26|nr:aminoacylase-1 isoform X1 [Macrosteles quadrilineatus]
MSANEGSLSDTDLSALTNFKEYLRIPSVHPDVNYDGCEAFLRNRAEILGLPIRVFTVAPKKPVILISWLGSEPQLPSLLLNSHMDVVPVFPENWTYPPFGAETDSKGNIYARGSQDMKCVGIQYLEAVERLMKNNQKLKRTIHILFVPDEEIGGLEGMKLFIESEDFKNLNVGCALDEGIASPDESYQFFYGERPIWHVWIHCTGTPGHGSLLHDDTAGEKLAVVIDKFLARRAVEKKKLKDNPELTIGDVTTINLTSLKGGVQTNVVPPELTVAFDCRLSVETDHQEFENWINEVCKAAGDGISVEYEIKQDLIKTTTLDSTNPWWTSFKSKADKLGLKLKCNIFPGGTDSRYIRQVGIPAFGFSPMNNTPVLLHDHDEFLNEKVFLQGIKIYCELLPALANL